MRLSFLGKKEKPAEPAAAVKTTEGNPSVEAPPVSAPSVTEKPNEDPKSIVSTKKDDSIRQPEGISVPSITIPGNAPDDIKKTVSEDYVSIDKLPSTSPSPAVYTVGMKITANYQNEGKYYRGTIKFVRENGNYDIDYADGEFEANVPDSRIRLPGATNASSPRVSEKKSPLAAGISSKKIIPIRTYTIGNRVEGRYRGRDDWKPGVIKKIRLDNSYDILYDDGEVETRVETELIRPSDAPIVSLLQSISEGWMTEVNYKSQGKYFQARIIKNRPEDKTVDVEYFSGECEFNVPIDFIRNVKYTVGASVVANYKGKGKFYPGKIKTDNGDDTYDIDYNDGEQELKVKCGLITVDNPEAPGFTAADAVMQLGSKVEGNYRGKGKWYPGKIKQVRADGTFDIAYDDGEQEFKVSQDNIRAPGSSAPLTASALATVTNGIEKGAKVEADYKGKGKYYPGKISRVHSPNSFDIAYDDGETESKVPLARIKVTGGVVKEPQRVAATEAPASGKPVVGLKIEGNYRQKGKWYPGKVKTDNGDGTYDISYDDGELEMGVHSAWIRVSGCEPFGFPTFSGSTEPKVGSRMKLPAYPHGESVGTVKAKRDRYFEVEIDGFLYEKMHPSYFVMLPAFVVGDIVEANFKNKGKFYPGVISVVNGGDSYDVNYDDGERETSVSGSLIRLVEANQVRMRTRSRSKSGESPQKKHHHHHHHHHTHDNNRVEANYRGKGRWFLARIRRVHGDGTYDIDYDDGEQETRVTKDMIRLLDGTAVTSDVSQPRANLNQALTHSKELELEAMEHTMASMQEKNIMMMDLIRVLQTDMETMKKRDKELTALVEQQGALIKRLLAKEEEQRVEGVGGKAAAVGSSPTKPAQQSEALSVKTPAPVASSIGSPRPTVTTTAAAASLAASVASAAVEKGVSSKEK